MAQPVTGLSVTETGLLAETAESASKRCLCVTAPDSFKLLSIAPW